MAFRLWCQVTGLSGQSYQSLLKAFDLLENLETMKHLPRTISTMNNYVKAQLPLLKLRPQEVQKLANRRCQERRPSQQRRFVFFRSCTSISDRTILVFIPSKLHIGMTHFVRKSQKFFAKWRRRCRLYLPPVIMRDTTMIQQVASFAQLQQS